MAEAIIGRQEKGGPDGSVATNLLDPDVLRVGNLPAAVTASEAWNFNDVTYRGQTRTAFELHLEANGGAWTQNPNDKRFYHFANRVFYDGTNLVMRLTLPTAPGAIRNGRVNDTPVAFAAGSSSWTSVSGQYEFNAPVASNPIPTIGEFTVSFTLTNGQSVWYSLGATATGAIFTGKDVHILSAFETDGYADIANAVDQGGLFTSAPDLSQVSGRTQWGTTFTWTGSTTQTWYKGFRVPVARRDEIRSFHAKVGSAIVTELVVLGDADGFTYGYIVLHGYAANTVISLQALGKVSVDTDRLDISGWNQALGLYLSGTLANLSSTAPAGSRGIVYGDTPGTNGLYYRLSSSWTLLADTPVIYATKAELDAVASPNGSYGIVTGGNGLGVYARAGGAWVQVGNVGSGGGGGLTEPQVDARVAAGVPGWTGQTANQKESKFAVNRIPQLGYSEMPRDVAIAGKAVREGGTEPWPETDDTVQISAFISNNPITSVNAQTQWGQQAGREGGGGFEVPNPHWLMRFKRSDYASRPTGLPEGVVIRLGEARESAPVFTAVADADATYWYVDATVSSLPAGDNVVLEKQVPLEFDATPSPGRVNLASLDIPASEKVDGNNLEIIGDRLGARRRTGREQLYNGTQGLTTAQGIASNSAVITIALNNGLNFNTAHSGVLHIYATLAFAAATDPTTLAFDADGARSIDADGELATFQAKRAAVYNGSTNLGESILEVPVYDSSDDAIVGNVVYRISKNASGDAAMNVRFETAHAHGKTGTGGSASARPRAALV